MGKKSTLEEIEKILSNRIEYRIIYEVDGKEITQVRDTIERAYSLYCRDNIEQKEKGRLVEIRPDGEEVILRGYGVSQVIEREKDEKSVSQNDKRQSKNIIQCLLGDMSYDEYTNAVRKFATMHGATLEDWGINL